jgi:hypothetical protein
MWLCYLIAAAQGFVLLLELVQAYDEHEYKKEQGRMLS